MNAINAWYLTAVLGFCSLASYAWAGSVCPTTEPNPCYNANGSQMTCCPASCGANNWPVATCESSGPSPIPSPSASPGSFLPKPPTGQKWLPIQALSDEFNEKQLDTTKWRTTQPYWLGRTPSQFDPANTFVAHGMAWLRSSTSISDMNQVSQPQTSNWIQSAILSSTAPVATLGYYEARLI